LPADYVPSAADVVSTGSGTVQQLDDAFALAAFDAHYPARSGVVGKSYLISWEATGTNPITLHRDERINRPSGAADAIRLLTSDPNVDFARSALGRKTSDTGITYVPFADDVVTVATTALPSGRRAGSFTKADLVAIYTCSATTFGALPDVPIGLTRADATATINAVLPESGSDTRTFFLAAIGVSAPGSCVKSADGSIPIQENNGDQPLLRSTKGVVFPYSMAVALAQTLHGSADGYSPDQNIGTLSFPLVDGQSPIMVSGNNYVADDTSFPSYLRHLVFHVVRTASANGPIPPDLTSMFGRQGTGAICTYGDKIVGQYGFGVIPKSICGVGQ
jgi:hypothetical protein